ncbi:MAG: OB-fold domain-containing protein [Ilumatobacteraceae bacterium]
MSETASRVPAVEGWFTVPAPGSVELPELIGCRCGGCGTYVFPPRDGGCPNPTCDSEDLERVPLSRRGRVWSYTENQYAPPPPYRASDPFEPFALAAVELAHEGLIVLGQTPKGVLAGDLHVGMEMQLELDVLYREDGVDHLVYVWAPAAPAAAAGGAS